MRREALELVCAAHPQAALHFAKTIAGSLHRSRRQGSSSSTTGHPSGSVGSSISSYSQEQQQSTFAVEPPVSFSAEPTDINSTKSGESPKKMHIHADDTTPGAVFSSPTKSPGRLLAAAAALEIEVRTGVPL